MILDEPVSYIINLVKDPTDDQKEPDSMINNIYAELQL